MTLLETIRAVDLPTQFRVYVTPNEWADLAIDVEKGSFLGSPWGASKVTVVTLKGSLATVYAEAPKKPEPIDAEIDAALGVLS